MGDSLCTVVKEGSFAVHSLLQRMGSPVTGTGIVRLIREPDGSYVLRLSDFAIKNDRAIPLRLMAFRAGPSGAARKPKDNYVDAFGEPLWLDGAMSGGLNGWILTEGAVINHRMNVLDNPEELHSIVLVKYRGDPPQADRSVIYLQAVLHRMSNTSRFAKSNSDGRRNQVLLAIEERVRETEAMYDQHPFGQLKVATTHADFVMSANETRRSLKHTNPFVSFADALAVVEDLELPLLPNHVKCAFGLVDSLNRGTIELQDLPVLLRLLKAGLQTHDPCAFRILPQDIIPLVTFGRSQVNAETVLSMIRMVGYYQPINTREARKRRGSSASLREAPSGQAADRCVGDAVSVSNIVRAYRHVLDDSPTGRLSSDDMIKVWCRLVDIESEAFAAFDDSDLTPDVGCFGTKMSKDQEALLALRLAERQMTQRMEFLQHKLAEIDEELKAPERSRDVKELVAADTRKIRRQWYDSVLAADAAAAAALVEQHNLLIRRVLLDGVRAVEAARVQAVVNVRQAEVAVKSLHAIEDNQVQEEIDLSGRGLPTLPAEVYVGKDAILQLGRTLVINLSRNQLQRLPEKQLETSSGVDSQPSIASLSSHNGSAIVSTELQAFAGLFHASRRRSSITSQLPVPDTSPHGDLFFHCSNLLKLDLSHNLLRSLPNAFNYIPALQILYLQDNKLVEFPPTLDQLGKLEVLDASFNSITMLPMSLIVFANSLRVLNLQCNAIERFDALIGEGDTLQLPSDSVTKLARRHPRHPDGSLIGFPSLQVLNLESNKLIRLPTWLAKSPSLQRLRLSRNPLTCIPICEDAWPQLTECYADVCEFGPVGILLVMRAFTSDRILSRDEAIAARYPTAMPKLICLTSNHSQLRDLPDCIGSLVSCVCLDVSDNRIQSLPHQIGCLTALTSLNLANNRLRSLPATIARQVQLELLDLSHNELTELPEEMGALRELRLLNANCNKLTALPATLRFMSSLVKLDVSENSLASFPTHTGRLTSLRDLNLSHNNFVDFPLKCPRDCPPNILKLRLQVNKLTSIPSEDLTGLTRLEDLDLSSNNIDTFPEQIALYLRRLRSLDLRHNHIQSFPLSLGSLYLKPDPPVILISHNPLRELRAEGFGYHGDASVSDGVQVDSIIAGDSKTLADEIDATLAEFAVKRYRVKEAVDRVWIGVNFPRVFEFEEFATDVKRELGVMLRDHMLEVMLRTIHRKLKADYDIPTVKPTVPTSLGDDGVANAAQGTSHIHRAAKYALSKGMTV